VDAVRLPKEIYFAERVMQNPKPDIHILGHWTYPAGTTKTMYVIANNCQRSS
jgi:beta-galactosidase